jgi:hypothetical protein
MKLFAKYNVLEDIELIILYSKSILNIFKRAKIVMLQNGRIFINFV